jgi:homoserine kinase type II
MLDHLATHGVETPRPLHRADGTGFTFPLEARGEASPRPIALFPWREGDILCQARVTPEAAREVGRKLADVHIAGQSYGESKPNRFRIQDLRARLLRVEQAEDATLRGTVPEIRKRLDRAENERDLTLPRGIIHSDLFRDNVLWQDGKLVALLDFESACEGSFAYDLMVTILAWCYGDDFNERLVRAMFEGYASRRAVTPAEIAAFATEARIVALRFMITRITDYSMRKGLGERVMKDYRRFWQRHERIDALGDAFLGWFS